MERHRYDVVVIGAGGAGLRAAIAAHDAGARTAIVCKSLLGKAHTVMAEGGIAAAMGNRWPEDNWEVHFRDTMRGGKMLNNWRMAQLHAQEAPERVLELEDWGALFDRTEDGLISQRDFGGHKYARLAHVGDRTGLEMIRTLQQRAVALGIDVFMECTVTDLLKDAGPTGEAGSPVPSATGARPAASSSSRRRASSSPPAASASPSRSPRTPGSTPATATPWRCGPGAALINMEFVQFHPTGMVWPPSVKGLLVTESVRGDGGILQELRGQALHVRLHPGVLQGRDRRHGRGGRPLVRRQEEQPPAARAAAARRGRAGDQLRDQGRPRHHRTAASTSTSPRGATPEFIRKRLPSMYHQFKELADVDITAEPMEIGPTCHYVMGGVEVDADTEETRGHRASTPSASAPAACTAPTGSAATRCRTCWSSASGPARRGGVRRRRWARPGRPSTRRHVSAARGRARCAPFERGGRREPLHDPARPPAVDERPGRHHPHRDRARGGAAAEIEAFKERAQHDGRRGAPAVQPRLAPRPRPAQHAAGRRECIAKAALARAGVARRPHPRRLPGHRTRSGAPRTSCCASTPPAPASTCHEQAAARDAGRAEDVLRDHVRGRTWATT